MAEHTPPQVFHYDPPYPQPDPWAGATHVFVDLLDGHGYRRCELGEPVHLDNGDVSRAFTIHDPEAHIVRGEN